MIPARHGAISQEMIEVASEFLEKLNDCSTVQRRFCTLELVRLHPNIKVLMSLFLYTFLALQCN
jgi:hypothetical protein